MIRLLRLLAAGAIVATLAGCSIDDNYTARVHDLSQASQAQSAAQGLQAQADAVKAQAGAVTAQAQAQKDMFQTLADAAQGNTALIVLILICFMGFAGCVVVLLFRHLGKQTQATIETQARALALAESLADANQATRLGLQAPAPGYLPAPVQVEPRGYLHTDPGAPLVPASIREYADQVGGVIVFYPDRGWRIVVPATGRVIRPRLITQQDHRNFTG